MEQQQQQQQLKERKARLSKMRERTRVLLKNHDWEKYGFFNLINLFNF